MDDRTFHDLVDALEAGAPLPADLDADDVAALTMARQLFAERRALPAAMAERRWAAEAVQANAATAARRGVDGPRRRRGLRWLPEVALLGLIALLAAVMLLGTRRGAMPAQGGETPVAVATGTPGVSLSGRLLIVKSQADGGPGLVAIDMRSGKETLLWSVPVGPDADFAYNFNASPDGAVVAYLVGRDSSEDPPRRLVVRSTLPGAQPANLQWTDGSSDAEVNCFGDHFIWSQTGNHLYFGKSCQYPATAALQAFEVHRLAVERAADGSVTLGPDETLWRVAPSQLKMGDGTSPSFALAAVHEPSGRLAILSSGSGDSGSAVAIQILDIATGKELAREPIRGEIIKWAATQDGSRLAFVDCVACDSGGQAHVRRLDVATAGDRTALVDLAELAPEDRPGRLVWSPTNRWLAIANPYMAQVIADPVDPTISSEPAQQLGAPENHAPAVFSPQGDLLLTIQSQLYDSVSHRTLPLPWTPPADGLFGPQPNVLDFVYDGNSPFLDWVPDELAPTPPPTASAVGPDRPTSFASPTPQPPTESAALPSPVTVPVPVATGAILVNDAWSPDGRWLAYWQTLDRQKDGGLHLFDVSTGQHCDQAAVMTYMYEHGNVVDWQTDGELHVTGNVGKHYRGQPCAGPLAAVGEPTPTRDQYSGARSPDGAYRAETQLLHPDTTNYTEHWQTRLVRNADDRVVATVEWEATAKMLPDLGGEWLPDGRFLVHEDEQRGPLLVDVNGGVSEVAATWFKLGPDRRRSELYAGVLSGSVVGDWHVLLSSADQTDIAWVYHPEMDVAEQITVSDRWASLNKPAPRGWLVDRGGAEHLSVRPLDPAGGAFTPLAAAADLIGEGPDGVELRWSRDGSRAVLAGSLPSGAGELRVISFPDGVIRSRWQFGAPFTRPEFADWSPDNHRVAVYVTATDRQSQALYVLDAGAP